jgi:hypothetical protein
MNNTESKVGILELKNLKAVTINKPELFATPFPNLLNWTAHLCTDLHSEQEAWTLFAKQTLSPATSTASITTYVELRLKKNDTLTNTSKVFSDAVILIYSNNIPFKLADTHGISNNTAEIFNISVFTVKPKTNK